MSPRDGDLLILGIGNVLMQDEGVGVHVAQYLTRAAKGSLPPDTQVVDGGTRGLDLLPLIHDARAVVFIDAVDFGREPGHVEVLPGDQLGGRFGNHLSSHQVGTADLLAVGRLTETLPDQVALVGIQPAVVEVGLELTDAVRAAVPVAAAVAERQAWAFAERAG